VSKNNKLILFRLDIIHATNSYTKHSPIHTPFFTERGVLV